MYNVKENEIRLLERIEEYMLRKLFKTGQGCPIYQHYFESGHCTARYQVKEMKLVFYQYILKQEENSLLFKFLLAQKEDWYSETQKTLKEF